MKQPPAITKINWLLMISEMRREWLKINHVPWLLSLDPEKDLDTIITYTGNKLDFITEG